MFFPSLTTASTERRYNTGNLALLVSELNTNLPASEEFFVDFYSKNDLQIIVRLHKTANSSTIRFKKSLLYNSAVKIVALGYGVDGAYWADDFILQDGVVNIEFTSQGEASGSGELKTFSGSLTQDGQPVSRTVYVNAVGGDAPKMLASTISDAQGDYSLEWNGYTGQVVITAMDDYGVPFLAEALLSVGARVHPTLPNGYVYEAASAGALGINEPLWPVVAGESITTGEVQLVAKPFYRPKSAGPFTIT
jgi:hypothetical protein